MKNNYSSHAFLQWYISKGLTTTSQLLVLALCAPLIAGAHKLIRQAGELTYCASLDQYNSPIYFFILIASSLQLVFPLMYIYNDHIW